MTANFLTYLDSAKMTADLSQPIGTYAQLLDEAVAGGKQNYRFDGTGWPTSTDILFGEAIPYRVDQPSASQTPAWLSSVIESRNVHLVASGLCVADGKQDEAPVINAVGAALSARGGGNVVFDGASSSGGIYNLVSSPIRLHDNVTYAGSDSSR